MSTAEQLSAVGAAAAVTCHTAADPGPGSCSGPGSGAVSGSYVVTTRGVVRPAAVKLLSAAARSGLGLAPAPYDSVVDNSAVDNMERLGGVVKTQSHITSIIDMQKPVTRPRGRRRVGREIPD